MQKHTSGKNKLKVIFLGTGTSQGIPIIGCHCETCQSQNPKDKRLRVSVFINYKNKNIVIDIGPDFRQQMLRANIENLDALLITHEHNDHIIGLDDVRPFNFKTWSNMPVYAAPRVQETLKKRFAYIFEKKPYPGAPMIELRSISKEENFVVEGITVVPIEAMHGKLPVLGFRIGGFTYLTDVKTISEKELAKAKNSKVLVLSALHHKEHHSHLSLPQALDLIKKINPGTAYLTHLSHKLGLHETVSKTLPPNVHLAYDGLELCI
ncbi:MAG TPA: MBL fold metallo-hydrolase [Bacteroidetes bacterium]|nr:MBL fold metallo-hydrolase [Bacteroidota bacterium]